MSDEKPIPAGSWRALERNLRHKSSVFGDTYYGRAEIIAADYCAREAEKAEAREKCERGEHEVAGNPRGWCVRCSKWIKPEPTDRERLRKDLREEIDFMEGRMRLGDPRPSEVRHFRVRAAELRDFYRRTFGEECP